MLSTKKMESLIGLILLIGMLTALVLVTIGGMLYLLQHGGNTLKMELLQTNSYHTSAKQIWSAALSLSPTGIIELGLLTLVITQLVRVGLLVWFFAYIRDYRFTLFSVFILFTLMYSLIWRN